MFLPLAGLRLLAKPSLTNRLSSFPNTSQSESVKSAAVSEQARLLEEAKRAAALRAKKGGMTGSALMRNRQGDKAKTKRARAAREGKTEKDGDVDVDADENRLSPATVACVFFVVVASIVGGFFVQLLNNRT